MEIYFTWSGISLIVEEGKYCDPPGYWSIWEGSVGQIDGWLDWIGRVGSEGGVGFKGMVGV